MQAKIAAQQREFDARRARERAERERELEALRAAHSPPGEEEDGSGPVLGRGRERVALAPPPEMLIMSDDEEARSHPPPFPVLTGQVSSLPSY